jgi:hypothetical protein
MSPSDRVAQLYPYPPGSLFIDFYGSQGYGGGILTHMHLWYPDLLVLSNIDETFRNIEFSQLNISNYITNLNWTTVSLMAMPWFRWWFVIG